MKTKKCHNQSLLLDPFSENDPNIVYSYIENVNGKEFTWCFNINDLEWFANFHTNNPHNTKELTLEQLQDIHRILYEHKDQLFHDGKQVYNEHVLQKAFQKGYLPFLNENDFKTVDFIDLFRDPGIPKASTIFSSQPFVEIDDENENPLLMLGFDKSNYEISVSFFINEDNQDVFSPFLDYITKEENTLEIIMKKCCQHEFKVEFPTFTQSIDIYYKVIENTYVISMIISYSTFSSFRDNFLVDYKNIQMISKELDYDYETILPFEKTKNNCLIL